MITKINLAGNHCFYMFSWPPVLDKIMLEIKVLECFLRIAPNEFLKSSILLIYSRKLYTALSFWVKLYSKLVQGWSSPTNTFWTYSSAQPTSKDIVTSNSVSFFGSKISPFFGFCFCPALQASAKRFGRPARTHQRSGRSKRRTGDGCRSLWDSTCNGTRWDLPSGYLT